MERFITIDDVEAIAIGAGILGTGGGGNTYIGRVWLEHELKTRAARGESAAVRIIDAADLTDDCRTISLSKMGAPTVSNEKLAQGMEMYNTLRALEAHINTPMSAVLIGEIGGSNAIMPLIAALQAGLPVVDGDAMGRAFPELQMDTFSIGGVSHAPMALGDVHGNVVIFHTLDSAYRAEQFGRILTISMGGSAALAMPVITGAQAKQHLIHHTLTLAQRMGEAVLAARRANEDAAEVVSALGNGHVLFRGKIVDVERKTVQGFARGRMTIVSFGDKHRLDIDFQNENLIAKLDGEVVATVPDLITLVQLEDGEPIGTESLRYGLRVAVLAMPAPKELKTPRALEFVGPTAFGYPDVSFAPMTGNLL